MTSASCQKWVTLPHSGCFHSRPEVQIGHWLIARQLYETDTLDIVYDDAGKHRLECTPGSRGGTSKELWSHACGKAGKKEAYQMLPVSQSICFRGRIHLHVNQCTLNRVNENVAITHSGCKMPILWCKLNWPFMKCLSSILSLKALPVEKNFWSNVTISCRYSLPKRETKKCLEITLFFSFV